MVIPEQFFNSVLKHLLKTNVHDTMLVFSASAASQLCADRGQTQTALVVAL